VDTLGLLLELNVQAADLQDRDAAKPVLAPLKHRRFRLRLIWADGAYAGELEKWVQALRLQRKLRLEVIKRPKGQAGFKVLPRRWVVERTFGWLNRFRRLSKDYEFLTATSEATIFVTMIYLMVRRLAKKTNWPF